MPFPFTLVVAPPGRDEVRRLVRSWRFWVGLAATIALLGLALALFPRLVPRPSGEGGTLRVGSDPGGATILVDGQMVGQTPAAVSVATGEDTVVVRRGGYAAATYRLTVRARETISLAPELLLSAPTARRLWPPLPGTTILDASFLNDGRIALLVGLPGDGNRQLWVVDPTGQPRRVGPPVAHAGIALSPDGKWLAYIVEQTDPTQISRRVDQLWLAAGEPDAPPREIPSASRDGERLLDLTWAPDGQHLLLVSQDTGIDPGRLTHLRLFTPPQGPWRDLTSLPGDVVPGSYAWTPDGHHVAFLARTDRALALGILGTDDGRYRYVADLGAGSAQILPFPPLVWSPDSRRLVYAAADTSPARATGWFFGGRPPDHLYVADLDRPAVQPLGSAQGEAPVWWSPEGVPGQVVALARPKSGGPLVVRLVDPDGQSRDLVELGALPPATSFTARWDPGHARAIIATGDPGGLASDETSFWIESLRDEVS